MKFEKVSLETWANHCPSHVAPGSLARLRLPQRGTPQSAGYDFFCPYEFSLKVGQVIKLPLGIKWNPGHYENAYLQIVPRSGSGIQGLNLVNQVGIIDSDYYNNDKNEGMIMVFLVNNGKETLNFLPGDRVVQGIICPYYVTDDDNPYLNYRKGGFGSTDG